MGKERCPTTYTAYGGENASIHCARPDISERQLGKFISSAKSL
jgi:hypothetical protein